jgi:hypothetical protein
MIWAKEAINPKFLGADARKTVPRATATMPSRRKTQVPEQYLGYSLQPLRCLHLLLTAPPDATISLEVFEDVGQQQGSGATLASQTKSALTTNPVSDRAPELWKTLNNWMTAISTGLLD